MTRQSTKQRGVTLVEVMLTLALSALLLTSILAGRNSIRSTAQFSDAMERTKETILFTKSQANTSNNTAGKGTAQIGTGTTRYLMFGRSIRFTKGSNKTNSAVVLCYATDLACNGKLNVTEQKTAALPWNLKFTGYKVGGTAGTATDLTLVFGRDDSSGAAFTGSWYAGIIPQSANAPDAPILANKSTIVLEFQSPDGRKGTVTVTPSTGAVTRQVL